MPVVPSGSGTMATPSVKERLLRIATQRFASVGFEATTMRSVASRAGVTLPTLYHYFGDKQNLYLEACLATFGPRSEQALATYANSRSVEERKVLAFFVDLASELLENENFFKLMHREIIDQDREGIRRLAERCWNPAFNTLCLAFRELLPEDTDPVPVVFTSFALMFGLVEFRRTAPFLHESLTEHYRPRELATLVLQTTVPSIPWRTLTPPTLDNAATAKSREKANGHS
jgi:TetR/AcrR family transcriptional regulator